MSDAEELPAENEKSQDSERQLAFAGDDDFAAADINSRLNPYPNLDGWKLEAHLKTEAAASAEESAERRVLELLLVLCSFHLRNEPEGDAFGPRASFPNGVRSLIPVDLRGAQSDVLARVAPSIAHPFLRARMGEVAYENGNRRLGRPVIAAYCELIERRLEGTYPPEYDDDGMVLGDAVQLLQRAFSINARVAKKGEVVSELQSAHLRCYTKAFEDKAYFDISTLATYGMNYGLLVPAEVAQTVKALAEGAPDDAYDLAIKEIWAITSRAYDLAGDTTASREAAIEGIERTLKMRDSVQPYGAKAHWIKEAIAEYRSIGGCQDRVEALRAELREVQSRSLDDFGRISTSHDIGDLRNATSEDFAAYDPAEAFRQIMGCLQPPCVADLKAQALVIVKRYPLSNLFASTYSDGEGKEIARGPSLDFNAEPDEIWFKEHIIRNQNPVQHMQVHGVIEPARGAVAAAYAVQEHHFLPIVSYSPFVPPAHRHIFALGFARLWQGDYVTAGHLLIPQLENSIRHVLHNVGRDSSKLDHEGLQEDRALSTLLAVMKDELLAIFGEDLLWEIDGLFNFRPGPAIRHEFAHGKLGWGAFYRPATVLACWMVYYLTVYPLLPRWDDLIAPNIRSIG